MRYRFVDEIVSLSLDGTPRIEVAKSFAAGDDVFGGPSGPERVPESMLLELMAMTAGHLLFRRLDGRHLPLLVKVPECCFEGTAGPDERLRAVATLGGVSPVDDGTSFAEAETGVYLGARRIAHARLMFVCVSAPGVDLTTPGMGPAALGIGPAAPGFGPAAPGIGPAAGSAG